MNYNKLILGGRLTRDPETRVLDGGTTVANFGIAVNRKVRGRDGQYNDKVLFVDVAIFGKRAEAFVRFHSKGSGCLLEGHLDMDEWTDKASGQKRTKLKMFCEEWTFVEQAERGAAQGSGARGPREEPNHPPGPGADDTPF